MTAIETATAYERCLITEREAVEQAMADDLNDLYRRAIIEIAPHMAADLSDAKSGHAGLYPSAISGLSLDP